MSAKSNFTPSTLALHDAFVGIGSNISPAEHLPKALHLLQEYATVLEWSQAWQTPPYGMAGDNFLNAVVHLGTRHSANVLKSLILRRIEAMLGRIRTREKFIPRTIDLDILVFDSQIMDVDVWSQAHWAVPLAELLPLLKNGPDGLVLHEIARHFKERMPEMIVRPNVLEAKRPAF